MNQISGTGPDDRPLLLVISTGPQRYREYLFRSMRTRYRIHLINTAEATWEREHIVGATVVATTDIDLVLAAAREIAATARVAGVLSWDEARIHQAAQVAAELGLPTTDPDAVWRCRDKYGSRTALAAAGVPQPRFALVGTAAEGRAAAEEIGFPVVLKPRAAAASYGVVRAVDADEVAGYFAFAAQATVPHMPRYERSVLIEEYLDHPEISIDSVVYGGQVVPLFLAHKVIGYAPYFEETGHIVSNNDPLLRDPAMVEVLRNTHNALGITTGWTHAEFKLTETGPKVIEVNGRLGGDLIPYLGMRASGLDPGLIAAAVACGREPEIVVDRELVSAIRFFYVAQDDTIIASVEFDDRALPPGLEVAVLADSGAVVSPPPRGLVSGRIAFAIAVAATAKQCRDLLDGAGAALRTTWTAPAEVR
jgi:biotin carboxylase